VVRYRILGPLALLDDEGNTVPLGGRRERTLLATLLLEANQVVSRDRLIDALWGDHPPETASNALQVHISKLRRALTDSQGTAGPLHTESPGYVLRTSPGELDAERFETMVTDSARGDQPDVVSATLRGALNLWAGPVLDGIELDASWRSDITRLEELRISVLERRIEADLALGQHRELVGELEALVQAHPWRERLTGQLMLALYRSGRQADALGAYGRTRQVLVEEHGIDPTSALQELQLAILNQSPLLDGLSSPGDRYASMTFSSDPFGAGGHATRLSPALSAAGAGNAVPLPGRLAVRPPVGVVGREPELEVISDAYKRVVGGGGREMLLVSGEAGLGKTTLVAEAARVAFDNGACVLFGHCDEDLTRPYQFFAEALEHYVTHAAEDRILRYMATHGSELSRLAPSLLSRLSDLPSSKATDTDTERYLLFAAAVGLVAMVSEYQPVVLVLDDLQWADKGSLALLRHLVATEQSREILILATYRDSELTYADALRETLGTLRRHDGVGRIELTGLDDSAVVSYLEAAAGQDLDEAGVGLAHAVFRETDGNPFFVSEVLRHLSETGAIYREANGRWVVGDTLEHTALPDSVREVIGGRVVRLGKNAERVLGLAAVIGRDFDLDILSQTTSTSENDLLDILDAAAAVALVGEISDTPGRFSFTHALIQHTLYEDLGPTRRARAHRRVAEALEELWGEHPGTRVGELARHFVAAIQPVDIFKAISYSRQAGDAALTALAPADALRYYTQALELTSQRADSDPVLELDLLIGLGTAQRQTGDATFRDTLLHACRRAIELDDTDHLVAAALANDRGSTSTMGAVDVEKIEILEKALDRLPSAHADRALILATLCSELTIVGSLDRRKSLAGEALAIAEQNGDNPTVVQVHNLIGLPLAVPHLLQLSLAHTSDALRRAEQVGDPVMLCTAASGRRYVAACDGDIEEMDRCFEIKRPLVERLDQPFLNWVHTLQLVTRALITGDADEAQRLATEALQIGSDGGQPDAILIFGAQMIMVNLWRGTVGELLPLIEQAVIDNPELPVFVAALALAHAETGRTEETRALLTDFAARDFHLPLDATWLTGMIAYADAAAECRDPQFVGPILEQLEPFSDQWLYTDIATAGPVSRSVGDLLTVLGRYGEAETQFAQAADSCQRAGARYFAARTDLSWGRMLAERHAPGDSEQARSFLTRARQAGASHGYGNVERRAAQALQMLDDD
jgi:DNA-binding SARP family transcriptional activator